MKIKKTILLLISVLLIGSILSACGKGAFSIEGTWSVIDDKGTAGTVDFKSNDTFILSSGVIQVGGNYTFENEKLTLTYADEEPRSYEVEIGEDNAIKCYSLDKDGNRTDEETLSMTKED